ncbi:STAS domain-containing protein [Pseudonocardia xishanensis]|uniref:Anti-sigma factor antagonist n=1 Tax=Pseudonocardia xishanensis TaxID=630995 RepID=A0ABP8S1M1_9PSEU
MSTSHEPTRPGALGTRIERLASGVLVLWVDGEIDTLTAPTLGTALGSLLDTPGDGPVAVDLSEVGFLASSGLAVLIRAAHRAESQGRALHLVGGGRAVVRPLQVTGSDRLFTLHEDLSTVTVAPRPGESSPRAD